MITGPEDVVVAAGSRNNSIHKGQVAPIEDEGVSGVNQIAGPFATQLAAG
jgi:hypothetical protein